MGWWHPDISLEDLLKLVKGFVDILILASGYQSSGSFAHWDTYNIKKAFQWGIFFENVFRRLRYSDDYEGSIKELDAALSEIKSNPFFPQGIAHLSSVTLRQASNFVLQYLLHALPLRDAHLKAFAIAAIEMDLSELQRTENDCIEVYLRRLVLQKSCADPDLDCRAFMEGSLISSRDVSNMKIDGDFTRPTIQELAKRQLAVSCISSAEAGLDILCKSIRQRNWNESDSSSFKELQNHATAPQTEDQLIDYDTWNCWRTHALSYFINRRTIGLVSGASMIFSASEAQWVQVFEKLNISAVNSDDMVEILLLGCVASKWSSLIEHFMLVSYDSISISRQYHEVCSFPLRRIQNLHSREEMMSPKVKSILKHLAVLLETQPHQLWKLSPALAAVGIPSWSPLFRLYLSELDSQFKGDSTTIRCCCCVQDRKEHKDFSEIFFLHIVVEKMEKEDVQKTACAYRRYCVLQNPVYTLPCQHPSRCNFDSLVK